MTGELPSFLEENYNNKLKNVPIKNSKDPFTNKEIKLGQLYDGLNQSPFTVQNFFQEC